MNTCGSCNSRWTGNAMAHCAGCHETFSVVGNFDLHRSNGKCLRPPRVGLKKNFRGTWLAEGERDFASEMHPQAA